MLEAFVNTTFTTIVSGPNGTTAPTALLYVNGTASGLPVTVVQQGSSSIWTVSFTPNSTGVYTLVAFAVVQFRVTVVTKSVYSYLTNIEDEALGSWAWDKQAGTLTLYRQDGSTLSTFDVVDTLTTFSTCCS